MYLLFTNKIKDMHIKLKELTYTDIQTIDPDGIDLKHLNF